MNPPSAEARLARLASAYQLSRAVQVAARLGLGRLLDDGPRTLSEMARATSCDRAVLLRLLRFLVELEVVAAEDSSEDEPRFGPTELSRALEKMDHPAQGFEAWDVWGALPDALRHGRPVFSEVCGKPFYDYVAERPRLEQAWTTRNLEEARILGSLLAEHSDLNEVKTVVDVGGGVGAIAAEILSRRPAMRAAVCDLPSVIERGDDALRKAGFGEDVRTRISWLGTDARREIDVDGDLFLLCRMLFNWDDDDAVSILHACRRAMERSQRSARLRIAEPFLPEPGEAWPRGLAAGDLHHFLLWGGRHRTRAEHAALCEAADLELTEEQSMLYVEVRPRDARSV